MFSPSRRTTLPVVTLMLLLSAGCGSPAGTSQGASTTAESSAATSTSSSVSSPAVSSPPSPPASAPGLGGDQGQCSITPEELQAATGLTWQLGRTLPEQPWDLKESIKASTCAFISREKEVTDSYGQPLILRIDTATGVHAAAMEKYDVEVCDGTMRAPRGGGGGKVCDVNGQALDGSVVKDGTAMSILLSSDSKKILKDFSPKFEAVIAAIAD